MDFFIQSLLQPHSSDDFLKDLIYIQSFSIDNHNDNRQKDLLSHFDRQTLNRKYDRVDSFMAKNIINLKKNTKRYIKEESFSLNPYQGRNSNHSKIFDQNQSSLPPQVHPTQIEKSFEDHQFDFKIHNLLRQGLDIFKVDQVKRRKMTKKPSVIQKPCQCCGKQSHPRHKCLHTICQKKCGKVKSRSKTFHQLSSKQQFNSQSYEDNSSDIQWQFSKTKKNQSQQQQSQFKYQTFQPSQALIKQIDKLLVQPYDLEFSYKIIEIKQIEEKQNSNQNNSNNSEENDILNRYNAIERDKISQVESKSQISESRRNNSIKQVLKSVYSNSQHQVSNEPHFNLFTLAQRTEQGEQKKQQKNNENHSKNNESKQKQISKGTFIGQNTKDRISKSKSKKQANNQMSQNSQSDQEKRKLKTNNKKKLQQFDQKNQQSQKEKDSNSKNDKLNNQNQEQEEDQISYDSNFKKILMSKSRGDIEIQEEQFQNLTEIQKLYFRNRLSSRISVQEENLGQRNCFQDQVQKLLNQNSQIKKRERFQSEELVEYDILSEKIQEKQQKSDEQQKNSKEKQYEVKGLGKGKGRGMGSGLGIFQHQLFMDQEQHHNDQQFNKLITKHSQGSNRQMKISSKRDEKRQKLANKQKQKKQILEQIKKKLKNQEQQQKQLYEHEKGLGHGKGWGMGHGMGMAFQQELQNQLQREMQINKNIQQVQKQSSKRRQEQKRQKYEQQ